MQRVLSSSQLVVFDAQGRTQRTASELADRADISERAKRRIKRFWECNNCGAVYWRGRHHAAMLRRLAGLLASERDGSGAGSRDTEAL